MATRDELDEIRATLERRNTTAWWLRSTPSTAVIALDFFALLLIFTR